MAAGSGRGQTRPAARPHEREGGRALVQSHGVDGAHVAPSKVLLVACAGAFLAFLDATIVNIAFPSIVESFPGTTIGNLSWVLNAYNIVFAAFLIVFGRLTDLVGRRRVFVLGVLLFTVASVLCAVSPSVGFLVAARVLQALGAAMLVPASLALVIEAFPDERRSHAIGLWGATAAVAAGLGPPIGGALVQIGDWRWAFMINLPFGAVALWAARSQLVESRSPGRRTVPDLPGAALLAACLAVLNLGIIKGGDWGWTSVEAIVCFGLAVAFFALFVRSSRRHRSPLLDPALLRISSFNVASIATTVAGFGFFAYMLTNVLWLQYVWGYDVLTAGLALVPGALIAAIVASRLGPLAERYGYRPFVVPGALVWAGAYLWYHQQVGIEPAFWTEWMPGQVLSGIGVGATLPLLGSAALAAVPGGRYATASAVVSSARQFGGVLGIAILVVIIGDPSPATAETVFREGWMMSVVAFLVVALLALPLGKLRTSAEDEGVDDGVPARVQAPEPSAPGPTKASAQVGGPTDLSTVPMFEALPLESRHRLESASTLVAVPAGTWLIQEGDPPGSAYLVRRGRLEVSVGGRIVRELGPGDVLGEIALLTGERRSAGVRARRDSTVLEVPRAAFEAAIETDPSASRFVLTQVVERLRTAEGHPEKRRPVQPSVVAVVGMHQGSGAGEVAEVLHKRLATHLSVVSSGVLEPDGLERAEADHDRVLLVADGADSGPEGDWREFCLRQADAVVLVARADAEDHVLGTAPVLARQPDLVLLGADPGPAVRVARVAATDAWQLTVVDGDLGTGLRALADRLAGRSLGLVLAGGGARAFAHVGVLSELADAGLYVDRVAGSSIGAVVAALHASGLDSAALQEVCYAEWVRRQPFSDWRLPTHSLSAGRRVNAAMVRALGADSVLEGLPRQLHTVSTDLVTRTRQVHRRGRLVDAANASVRLPVLFAPIPCDDGRLLIDGGVLDNLPVDVLTERDEGPVVAVNISMGGSGGEGRARTGPPRIPALGETLLRTMMIGSGGAVASARAEGAWVLTPPTLGVGLLEFHQLDRMVLAGRAAARALLEEASGDLFGEAVSASATPEDPAPALDQVATT